MNYLWKFVIQSPVLGMNTDPGGLKFFLQSLLKFKYTFPDTPKIDCTVIPNKSAASCREDGMITCPANEFFVCISTLEQIFQDVKPVDVIFNCPVDEVTVYRDPNCSCNSVASVDSEYTPVDNVKILSISILPLVSEI